jgi:hypothetical protein
MKFPIALLLAFGALIAFFKAETETEASGNATPTSITLAGYVDHTMLKALKHEGSALKLVVLNSTGGDIVDAVEIAEYIQENGIDVKVEGLCLSACASIILPAGVDRKIGRGSFVGFHGSLTGRLDIYDDYYGPSQLATARSLSQRIVDIYRRSKLNPDVLYQIQNDLEPLCVDNSLVLTPENFEPLVYSRYQMLLAAPEFLNRTGLAHYSGDIRGTQVSVDKFNGYLTGLGGKSLSGIAMIEVPKRLNEARNNLSGVKSCRR